MLLKGRTLMDPLSKGEGIEDKMADPKSIINAGSANNLENFFGVLSRTFASLVFPMYLVGNTKLWWRTL